MTSENALAQDDRPIHGWYTSVLAFPAHLVRTYLDRFAVGGDQVVCDPFCGTGTVLVECRKRGTPCVGVEANPMAHFASLVKLDWTPEPDGLLAHARRIADAARATLAQDGLVDVPAGAGEALESSIVPLLRALPPERQRLLLTASISPLPLHKALTLLDTIELDRDMRYVEHERLALAQAVVRSSSNLQFGPEIGLGPIKPDAPVIGPWLTAVEGIARDLHDIHLVQHNGRRWSATAAWAPATVHLADARDLGGVLEPQSIDVVISSPPYPNEKDYTRATRLESVLLGFVRDKAELRALKRGLLRSNTRGVYTGDDDDQWVAEHPEIQHLADAIEARRLELGKTSGFEKLYATVTRQYFGGMARHLANLRPLLRPGAQLAYVVGDQASYLQVLIPTGQIVAEIAQSLGYEVVAIDLFRLRRATATRAHLREEVVVLRWPGPGHRQGTAESQEDGRSHAGHQDEEARSCRPRHTRRASSYLPYREDPATLGAIVALASHFADRPGNGPPGSQSGLPANAVTCPAR